MAPNTNVNKPTDLKVKEADVNRKLQIYGIISAFQAGKVPSNDQIDVALNSFIQSKPISSPSNRLSTEGQALVNDVSDVVKQAKFLLLSKNEGNLLQDFIYQTQQFDPKSVTTPDAPINKETARSHGQDALQGFKTLGTLIITNGEFRKLLKDATILLRDIASDAATKAATMVRPSDEDLSQFDQAAPDNTWHDTPNFSKETLRKQVQNIYKGNPKADAQEVVNSGNSAAQASRANDDPNTAQGQAGAAAAQQSAQQKLSENVPEETKEKVRTRNAEYRARAKDYFNRKMPDQRRDQIIFRLKKMILECQQHPDYQQAIETLLTLAEQYGSHANTYARGSTDTAKQTHSAFEQAEADLKTLIERFANGTSTDGLWEAIDQIYRDADRDSELKDWFKSIDSYIRRCLQEQGYIVDDASNRDGRHLYDYGRYLLRDKYRSHTNRVIDEVRFLANQFDQDPQNKVFGQAMQKLFMDLGTDENGKPAFKKHLVKDLIEVIIPAILENTAYIPMPRIEYTDAQIDAVIENLVLESDNFAPNIFEVSSYYYLKWSRKATKDPIFMRNVIDVVVSGVQMDLRDVSYYVKKKQGFPTLTDRGVADILLSGNGLSFKMKMSTAEEEDRQHFFRVDKVDVDIKHLKINLKQSNHKLLFMIGQPILLKALRPAIQKAAEKAIRDQFNHFDAILFDIKTEAERGVDMDRADPAQKKNMYARYIDASRKKFLESKQKAQAMTADKKANMAITKEDSIFPQISLPGGISTKATEYRELAHKGDKWESPVFSIGNAEKSKDIPRAPQIKRKEAPPAFAREDSPMREMNLADRGYDHGSSS